MTRRRNHEPGPEVNLPVTPMLDMTFQLLTFFIFTYHPSAMEGQMEMTLPGGGEAKAKDKQDVNPDSVSDPDIKSETTVTVKVRTVTGDENAGAIVFPIEVDVKDGLAKGSVSSIKELEAYLKSLMNEKKLVSESDGVKVEAQNKLKWACVVEVMDACKNAGLSNVGFLPPPDLAPPAAGGN